MLSNSYMMEHLKFSFNFIFKYSIKENDLYVFLNDI